MSFFLITTGGGVFGWEPDTVTLQLVATTTRRLWLRNERRHVGETAAHTFQNLLEKKRESGDVASVFVDLRDSSLSVSETLQFCGFLLFPSSMFCKNCAALIHIFDPMSKNLFDGSFKDPKKTQACSWFPQTLSLTHPLLVQLAP